MSFKNIKKPEKQMSLLFLGGILKPAKAANGQGCAKALQRWLVYSSACLQRVKIGPSLTKCDPGNLH